MRRKVNFNPMKMNTKINNKSNKLMKLMNNRLHYFLMMRMALSMFRRIKSLKYPTEASIIRNDSVKLRKLKFDNK